MAVLSKRPRTISPLNDYIPDEILFFNILTRLPVQSLTRFKSVSKHWNAMIDDPEFIQSHSAQAKQKSSSGSSIAGIFQIKHKGTKQRGREYYFVPKESLVHFHIQISNPASIVGMCNGLLCFHSKFGFEICNPCTGEFLYLPLPRRSPPNCFTCRGFCYDPLKNEYKVIQIVQQNANRVYSRCMVYTFGSDNDTWKDITAESNLARCLTTNYRINAGSLGDVVNQVRAVNSKGALYWFFHDARMIMSFDIHREKFGVIEGPACPKDLKSVEPYIAEWQGCMCLTFQAHPINGGVWIYTYMSDARVWSDFVVPTEKHPKFKTGFLGGESRLLYWFNEGNVSFYFPEYETTERFPLPRGVDHSMVTDYEFVHHVNNPLSLKALLPKSVLDQDGRLKTFCPLQVRTSSFL